MNIYPRYYWLGFVKSNDFPHKARIELLVLTVPHFEGHAHLSVAMNDRRDEFKKTALCSCIMVMSYELDLLVFYQCLSLLVANCRCQRRPARHCDPSHLGIGTPLWGANFDYYDLGALRWFVNMKVNSIWRHMIEKWKEWKKIGSPSERQHWGCRASMVRMPSVPNST